MMRSIIIRDEQSRQRAVQMARSANIGEVVKAGKPTRTDEQNDKLHPMLRDIQRQVEGMNRYSEDQIKLRFLNALGTEMTFLPELEGEGMFPVGLRSSTLTKDQFSGLIELIYAYGAEHGVEWSEPKQQQQDEAA